MPRPTMSSGQRAANVAVAADALPAALAAALADPSNVKLWEVVETHGATIHRQARILAGKSRGG